jgi:hypothetical protein
VLTPWLGCSLNRYFTNDHTNATVSHALLTAGSCGQRTNSKVRAWLWLLLATQQAHPMPQTHKTQGTLDHAPHQARCRRDMHSDAHTCASAPGVCPTTRLPLHQHAPELTARHCCCQIQCGDTWLAPTAHVWCTIRYIQKFNSHGAANILRYYSAVRPWQKTLQYRTPVPAHHEVGLTHTGRANTDIYNTSLLTIHTALH